MNRSIDITQPSRRRRTRFQSLPARWKARDEQGQVVFLFAGMLTFLTVVGLLGVNIGVMTNGKTSAQRVADAAALAGCDFLPDTAAATTAATDYGTTQNNRAAPHLEAGNSIAGIVFTSTGGFANDTIRVNITRSQPLLAPPFFDPPTIPATAVCRKSEGWLALIIALREGSCDRTFMVRGTLDLGLNEDGTGHFQGGSAIINCGGGMHLQGSGVVNGHCLATPGADVTMQGGGSHGTAKPCEGRIDDPYADLEEPTATVADPTEPAPMTGCTYQGGGGAPPTPRVPKTCNASGNLCPGVYWGGITMSGNVTLQNEDACGTADSIYQLRGGGTQGGLLVQSGARVEGTGVTIFSSNDAYAQNQQNRRCGPINVESNAQFLLTPPADGPSVPPPSPAGEPDYPALILWQDAACNTAGQNLGGCGNTSTNSETANLGGSTVGVGVEPTGAVYFPNAMLCNRPADCGTPTSMHVIVVADQIDIGGCMNFDVLAPSGSLFLGPIRLIE
jgi:hypothetical protein